MSAYEVFFWFSAINLITSGTMLLCSGVSQHVGSLQALPPTLLPVKGSCGYPCDITFSL